MVYYTHLPEGKVIGKLPKTAVGGDNMAEQEMVPVDCDECQGYGVTKEKGTGVGKPCDRCDGKGGYMAPRFTGRKVRGDIETVRWRKGLPIAYGDFQSRVPEFSPSQQVARFQSRPDCDEPGHGEMYIAGDHYACRTCGATKPR
jgi:hypothetical protein